MVETELLFIDRRAGGILYNSISGRTTPVYSTLQQACEEHSTDILGADVVRIRAKSFVTSMRKIQEE